MGRFPLIMSITSRFSITCNFTVLISIYNIIIYVYSFDILDLF